MSHWRWRLWIQANDEPPIESKERKQMHPSWLNKAKAVYTRGMTPWQLMVSLRCGYRLAENILAELER